MVQAQAVSGSGRLTQGGPAARRRCKGGSRHGRAGGRRLETRQSERCPRQPLERYSAIGCWKSRAALSGHSRRIQVCISEHCVDSDRQFGVTMNMAMCECDEAARVGGRLSPRRRSDCVFRMGGAVWPGAIWSPEQGSPTAKAGRSRRRTGHGEAPCLVQDAWPLPAPMAAPISGRVGETPGDFTGI